MSERARRSRRPDPSLREVRRRDRAIEDPAWIRDLLRHAPVGVLATSDGAQPLLNANLFVLDPETDALYLHTARVGRTREAVEANPAVCFTAYELGRFLPADEALEFSVEFASVVATGRARVVTDRGEARGALQLLLDKYAPHLRPGVDYRPITDQELARTTVYRVEVESWSGKRKEVGEFPGAYRWPPPSSPSGAREGGAPDPGSSGTPEPPDCGSG